MSIFAIVRIFLNFLKYFSATTLHGSLGTGLPQGKEKKQN